MTRAIQGNSGGGLETGIAVAFAAVTLLGFLASKVIRPKKKAVTRPSPASKPAKKEDKPIQTSTAFKAEQDQRATPAENTLIRPSYSGDPNMRSANRLFGR